MPQGGWYVEISGSSSDPRENCSSLPAIPGENIEHLPIIAIKLIVCYTNTISTTHKNISKLPTNQG